VGTAPVYADGSGASSRQLALYGQGCSCIAEDMVLDDITALVVGGLTENLSTHSTESVAGQNVLQLAMQAAEASCVGLQPRPASYLKPQLTGA
jgi:hypothetical protein